MTKATLLEQVVRGTVTREGALRLSRFKTAVNGWSAGCLSDLSDPCWLWTGCPSARTPIIKYDYAVHSIPRALFAEIHGGPLDRSWIVKRLCQEHKCVHPGHYQMVQKFNKRGIPVVPVPARFRTDVEPEPNEDFEDLVEMIASIGAQRADPQALAEKPGWTYSIAEIISAQSAVITRCL